MKIAILIHRLRFGGAERQVVVLAKALQEKGHDVSVVAMSADGLFLRDLRRSGIRVVDLELTRRHDVYGPIKRLNALLKKDRPDFLYSFLGLSNVAATIARTASIGTRLAWGVRISDHPRLSYGFANAVIESLETRLMSRPDIIIANSTAGLRWSVDRGASPDRCCVIHNGFDPALFFIDQAGRSRQRAHWGISDHHPVIGIVARKDPMKDYPTFFAAAARHGQTSPMTRFAVVTDGESDDRKFTAQLAADHGIGDRILWCEDIHDRVNDLYNALDVICLSSAFGEGFPNVLAEAMLCGRTCVTTDVGDAGSIVGDLGRVVPTRDSIALADSLGAALDDPHRSDKSPYLRARIVDNFSLEACVDATERQLTEALSRPARSPG